MFASDIFHIPASTEPMNKARNTAHAKGNGRISARWEASATCARRWRPAAVLYGANRRFSAQDDVAERRGLTLDGVLEIVANFLSQVANELL